MFVADVERERNGTSAVKQKAGKGGVRKRLLALFVLVRAHTHARQAA